MGFLFTYIAFHFLKRFSLNIMCLSFICMNKIRGGAHLRATCHRQSPREEETTTECSEPTCPDWEWWGEALQGKEQEESKCAPQHTHPHTHTPYHVTVLAPVASASLVHSSYWRQECCRCGDQGVAGREDDIDVAEDMHSVSTEKRLHARFPEHHRCRRHEEDTRAPGQELHP